MRWGVTRSLTVNRVVVTVLVTGGCLLPFALEHSGDTYYIDVVARLMVLGVFVLGTDLAYGHTGIFTVGQAAFFGTGAYTAGLLSLNQGVTSLPMLCLTAMLIAAAGGVVLGAFLFSGRGVTGMYVALATLALTYSLERLANSWSAVGSANGLPSVPMPTLFGRVIEPGRGNYFVAFIALVVTMVVCTLIARSQLGLVMTAIRDDVERTDFFGYRRSVIQIVTFAIAASISGLAGALYGLQQGFVSPTFLGAALSTSVLLWLVLGGRGTIAGPLIGLLLIEGAGRRIQEGYPQLWPMIVGVLLLLCIVFIPRGIWGEVRRRMRRGVGEGHAAPREEPDRATA